jgi:hypothetical protein
MKMKSLAYITEGHSGYDDRLWNLLKDYNLTLPSADDFYMFDHWSFFSYFVVCGASIRQENRFEGTMEMIIEIPSHKEEDFYKKLENNIFFFKK